MLTRCLGSMTCGALWNTPLNPSLQWTHCTKQVATCHTLLLRVNVPLPVLKTPTFLLGGPRPQPSPSPYFSYHTLYTAATHTNSKAITDDGKYGNIVSNGVTKSKLFFKFTFLLHIAFSLELHSSRFEILFQKRLPSHFWHLNPLFMSFIPSQFLLLKGQGPKSCCKGCGYREMWQLGSFLSLILPQVAEMTNLPP